MGSGIHIPEPQLRARLSVLVLICPFCERDIECRAMAPDSDDHTRSEYLHHLDSFHEEEVQVSVQVEVTERSFYPGYITAGGSLRIRGDKQMLDESNVLGAFDTDGKPVEYTDYEWL